MTSSVANLSSTFTSMIESAMEVERQPLTALQTKKDTYETTQAIYTDLSSKLNDFENSVNSMLSTNASYSFTPQRKATISNTPTNATVLTASASSSAIPATYQVAVTSLAKEHRVRSNAQTYANQALGYSGSFLLSGNGTASISSFTGQTGTIENASLGSVETGKKELGTDTYYVETRKDDNGNWQFRLVNSDGDAVSIKKSTGKYSSTWQNIPTGTGTTYDTGRGIVIDFGSDQNQYQTALKGSGAAAIAYQAKGVEIAVDANDSLSDIAYSINKATFAEGDDVVATILDNQLVLSRKATGAGNYVIASDKEGSVLSGLGILDGGVFKNEMQTPGDAVFSVNNIQITRSENTNLTDVIQGVTLNLAPDAEDSQATITVTSDLAAEKTNAGNFVTNFNSLVKYLGAKLATEKGDDGTYTRGALAGDSMFMSLRLQMIQEVNASTANSGSFKKLSELGITMDNDFNLSISNSSLFEEALTKDRNGVTSLMDSVMTKLKTTLAKFTGTDGYMNRVSDSVTDQIDQTSNEIDDLNTRLTKREQELTTQYANLQTTLMLLSYQSDIFSTLYGND